MFIHEFCILFIFGKVAESIPIILLDIPYFRLQLLLVKILEKENIWLLCILMLCGELLPGKFVQEYLATMYTHALWGTIVR